MKWLMAIPVWSTPRDSLNRFNLVFSRCPYEESPFGVSFLLVWDGVAFNGPPVTAAAAWLPLWGSCHDEAVTERENLL